MVDVLRVVFQQVAMELLVNPWLLRKWQCLVFNRQRNSLARNSIHCCLIASERWPENRRVAVQISAYTSQNSDGLRIRFAQLIEADRHVLGPDFRLKPLYLLFKPP
ncbi:hypothetical protein [Kineobactrum sediminis]|uniref:hypothetical protein n=1 Tax=Kineobactrum sediminis TaxID=1905677 RepID=UPI0011AF9151|nr:hypothetical protein [Kineobactrum sediminis]